jgi:ribosome-associated translation inhibitor RaiA
MPFSSRRMWLAMKLGPPMAVLLQAAAQVRSRLMAVKTFCQGQPFPCSGEHMKIQVNTDDKVEGREKLSRRVEAEVSRALGHLRDHITRVEVHLSDEDSDKTGGDDKRCLMEARLAGRPPVAVTNHAGSLREAFGGAADKLRRSVERTLGRLKDHQGRKSIRGIENPVAPRSGEAVTAPRGGR